MEYCFGVFQIISFSNIKYNFVGKKQKYSRLRNLLHVKGLAICFYLGWSGSILQFRQSIIKVGSKSWLLTCSSNITLSLPSYTGSALKRELNFCNGYLSLLYFWAGLFTYQNFYNSASFRFELWSSFHLVEHLSRTFKFNVWRSKKIGTCIFKYKFWVWLKSKIINILGRKSGRGMHLIVPRPCPLTSLSLL